MCVCRSQMKRAHTRIPRYTTMMWLALFCVCLGIAASAQDYVYQTGSPAFSVAQPVPFGFLNLANGNPHLEIPLASAPQRSKLNFSAKIVYDGRIWQVVKVGGSLLWKPTNVPNSMAGWRFVTTADPGLVTFDTLSAQDCNGGSQKLTFSNFVWQDGGGTRRKFNLATAQDPGCSDDVSTVDGYALDSSGYHMYVTGYQNAVVFAKDGTQVFPTVQDTNGNHFSTDANGNVIDTLGRTLVTKTVSGNQIYYDVLNSQGTTSRFTVSTTSIPVKTNFGSSQSGITDDQENITVISTLGLPNGDSYSFSYDASANVGGTATAGYGMLTSISHSVLGTIVSFGYENFIDAFGVVNRWATNTVDSSIGYVNNGACPPGINGKCQTATLTRNGGTIAYAFSMQGGAWNISTTASKASTSFITSITKNFDFGQSCPGCQNPAFVTLQNVRTTVGGLTAQTSYTYDSPNSGNVTLVKQWNFYKGDASTTPPSNPDRQVAITYSFDAGLISNHITNRVTNIAALDGAGNQLSQTKFEYDTSTPLTQLTQTIVNLNTGVGASRGNLTKISQWKGGTSFFDSLLTYDSSGQMVQIKDLAGNLTKVSYADNFYQDNGSNPPATTTPQVTTNAYPTAITSPVGQVKIGYYYGSGKSAFAVDPNGQTTYKHYSDTLDRVTQIITPKGWQQLAYTSINVVDIYTGMTDTQPSTACNGCVHQQSTLDIFGHLAGYTLKSDPAGAVTVNFLNDIMGNVVVATNPSRTSTAVAQTQNSYDVLYRPTQSVNPDGSVAKVFYSGDVAGAGGANAQLCASATYGLGDPTLSVDEVGRKHQVWQDAFGRVIEADEPDANNLLTVPTCYQYNSAGQLAQIVQGSLTRSYQYDLLGRVTQVTTPEGGTETYSYMNDDGTVCDPTQVCKRVDARQIATRYQYDGIGRLKQRSYSDGTPTAFFNYDESSADPKSILGGIALTNTIGRPSSIFTKDSNGNILTGEVFSYDTVGNLIDNSQCTPENCIPTPSGVSAPTLNAFRNTYTPDLLGNMVTFSNSWGRTLNGAYDTAGQLTSLSVTPSDATHPGTVFSNPKYNEFGSLVLATLGNGLETAYGYSKTTGRLNSARIGGTTSFGSPAPGNVAAPGVGTISVSGSVQQLTTTAAPGSAILTLSGGTRQVPNGTQPALASSAQLTVSGMEQLSQTIENSAAAGSGTVTINGAIQSSGSSQPQLASPATSSLAISGTLKSTLTGATGATQATGSVIISGKVQSKTTSTRYCAQFSTRGACVDWEVESSTTYDSGSVTVIVNGSPYTYNYNTGDNVGTIASNLQSTINNHSPYVQVTSVSTNLSANPPTATLYLQARSSGTVGNYPLSSSSAWDTADFSAASFATSNSGSSLTGGNNAFPGNTVYDTGTLSVSITTYPSVDPNPKTYTATATYGAGTGQDSSAAAVASDLSQKMSAQGSPLAFSTSGSAFQVTAPAGSAGNSLVINCSSSTSSPTFSSPSFTCPSISSFSQGLDAANSGPTWDTGTVSMTVGNYTATAAYGSLGSTTNWTRQDLTALANTPAAVSPLTGFSTSPTAPQHLFYLSSQHVHELYTDSSGQWHDQDNTTASGGPSADPFVGGDLTAFAFPLASGFAEHVFYLDTSEHVHEQYSDSSGNWHDQDNTVASGAPVATPGGSLSAFSTSNSTFPEHVFYADRNNHVHEQYLDSAGQWHDQDRTAATGAPPFGCTLTSFYWPNSSSPEHVLYVDTNGHIQELYADVQGAWHVQDDTALTGAPVTSFGQSSLACDLVAFLSQGSSVENAFFATPDAHVHHLWNDSAGWHHEDATSLTGSTGTSGGISGFADSNTGYPYLLFAGRDQNLYELWKDSSGFHQQSVSAGAGGPAASFFDGLGAHAFYFDIDRHIWEIQSVAATASGVASALVTNSTNGLNLSGSPVQPTLSGNTISLVAKKPGLSTNYSLSVSSTYNTVLFSRPSFTGTYPPTMTGGLDGTFTPLYDSGTVALTVNNHADFLEWGLNSTPQSIAADLAVAVNLDAGAPVAATSSGNVVTLTSKATGANTNYPFNVVLTNDSADFSTSSFQIGSNVPFPAALQGGRDANGVVWDTGTVTLTVNGFSKQLTYGQSDTIATLATAITNAFNTDPNSPVWVCLCSTGPASYALTFTTRKSGSSTNYSVSVVSASNNSNFTGTSFPASFPGSTLTGGVDSGSSQVTLADSGVASVTVGSLTAAVEYGQTSASNPTAQLACCTAANVASALANIVNQSTSAPVIAAVNGGQLSLTAKTGGSGTNYTISASSVSNDPAHFPTASFSFSPGAGSLTGGADKSNPSLGSSSIGAVAITQIGPWQSSDACDVRLDIFVASSDYSTCIGPSSATAPFSAGAFAAQVAQSINQLNSSITASSSGGTVYLQSSTGGANTNYPLQAVIRIFNAAAVSPISVVASGPTMTGGSDNGGFVYALDLETDPSGVVSAANDSVNGNWTYFYDDLGRLQEAFTPAVGYTYDYDIYGNRLHQTPKNGGNTLSLVYVNNQISASGIQYDASGDMISDGNHTYSYDAENRLVAVDGGQTATYVYNAGGLRVHSTVGANFFDFIHDGSGETVGVLGSNTLIRQEIGGLATYYPNGAYFHHRDWLGNLRAVTDQAGNIKQNCTNLPYGDALNCTSAGITPLDFTGYMRDSETNLDFANARYYSSQFGRFTSPDPLGGSVANPQSLNRYAYVSNSPLSAIDPSGMDGCTVLEGFANCTLTFDGGGSGGGGPFGGAGGPFAGGISGIGGGDLTICTLLDCGFGGGGSPLPGAPSVGQIASERTLNSNGPVGQPEQHSMWYYMFHMNTSGTSGVTCDEACFNAWMAFHEITSLLGGVYGATSVREMAPGETVIGHYPGYVELAEELNARYFSIPMEKWNTMTAAERWAANQAVLDAGVERGDTFPLSTPINKVRPGSTLEKEIDHLTSRGYRLNGDGTALVPGPKPYFCYYSKC